jgi:5'-methylthioadenosine phosphorylase
MTAIKKDKRVMDMRELAAEIGIIGRFDAELQQYGFQHVVLETEFGRMDRLFLGEVDGRRVAVIYGRFDKVRLMSSQINSELIQATFNKLGVRYILGTFVVGSIQPEIKIGEVFILDDLVGMGNFQRTLAVNRPFKNVDMYRPFCETVREALIRSAEEQQIETHHQGTYVCFHGYPRIETRAELQFYTKMGWHIVGQTLDPEATLAKESGCCYGAVAVTIDEAQTRNRFVSGDTSARVTIQEAISSGRVKTTKIVFSAIRYLPTIDAKACNCDHNYQSEKSYFAYLPNFLL